MEYGLSGHTQLFVNKQLRPLMEMWKCVQWKWSASARLSSAPWRAPQPTAMTPYAFFAETDESAMESNWKFFLAALVFKRIARQKWDEQTAENALIWALRTEQELLHKDRQQPPKVTN